MLKDKSPVYDDIAQVVRLILKIEFGGNFSTMLVKSDNSWDISPQRDTNNCRSEYHPRPLELFE